MDSLKRCPYCAEDIKEAAIKCRHCGSMLNGADPATAKDVEHLRLLQTGHTVLAAITGFFACMPLLHVAMGVAMLVGPDSMFHDKGGKAPPAFFAILFIIMGGAFVAAGWTLAVLIFFAGKFIGQRRRHTFCVVVAGLSCLFMPFGTVLGVFSLMVLNRPTVKPLFAPGPPA